MILLRQIDDPRITGVTITGADISPDLRHAKIYWVSGGSEQQKKAAQEGLDSATRLLRRELGRGLQLRNVPEIRFIRDDTLDKAAHIETLIKEVMEQERAAEEVNRVVEDEAVDGESAGEGEDGEGGESDGVNNDDNHNRSDNN